MAWPEDLSMKTIAIAVVACFASLSAFGSSPVFAQTIIEDWAKVKPPAPPEIKPVTIDVASTALLILDFNGAQDPTKGPCQDEASLPGVGAQSAKVDCRRPG
jgi:hypothetical protein